MLFGLRTPLHSSKLRTPESFCLCGLHLLTLTLFKIKIEKFKNIYITIYLKMARANPFQVNLDNIFYEK